MRILLWICSAIPLSLLSKHYGSNEWGTYYILTTWILIGFTQVTKGHKVVSFMKWYLREIPVAIQAFLGKYWCKEKGYWIDCEKNCKNCQIQTKRRITLWEARVFYLAYYSFYGTAVIIGAYIIWHPEFIWG